jgi:HK97 family phage major capsid protein
MQASLGTADIGTISDASVIFHQLVTPASALLASGPTVVDIDTTTGQVLLVNGRMKPAAVVPEGEPIEAEDPPVELADVKPPKYGKLVELSTEAYRDATPARVAIAEAAMVEAIGSGIDLACFHGAAESAQPGLENTAGVSSVDAEGSLKNLDVFVSALARLRRGMRRGTAFYMSPLTWERLGHLKKADESNEPLVSAQLSATGQPAEAILGVAVYQSDQIEEGIAFAARSSELVVIRRQDVETEVDPHYGFGSAEVGVRAITRLKLKAGDPTAVCLIENLPEEGS